MSKIIMIFEKNTQVKWSYGTKTYEGCIVDIINPNNFPSPEVYSNFRSRLSNTKDTFSYVVESIIDGEKRQYWVDGKIVLDINDTPVIDKYNELLDKYNTISQELKLTKLELDNASVLLNSLANLKSNIDLLKTMTTVSEKEIKKLGVFGLCSSSNVRRIFNNLKNQIDKLELSND